MEHIIYIYLIINALISGIYYSDSIQDTQDKFVCFGGIFLAIPVIILSFAVWFFKLLWEQIDNKLMISHKFRIKGDYYIKNFNNNWYRSIMEYKKKLEAKEKLSRYEQRGYKVILEVEKKVGHLYKKNPIHDEMTREEKIVHRLCVSVPYGGFVLEGKNTVIWTCEADFSDDTEETCDPIKEFMKESVPGSVIKRIFTMTDKIGIEFIIPETTE